MRLNKPLFLGILGALLVGGLASAGLATARGVLDGSPMTIPVGRLGDRLSYAEFVRRAQYDWIQCQDGISIGTGGFGGQSGSDCRPHHCEIGPANGTIEARGDCFEKPEEPTAYEAVVVDRLASSLDHEGRARQGLVVRRNTTQVFADGRWEQTTEEFVDLSARTVFRTDTKLPDGRANVTISQFTERFDGRDRLWYQGKTFRLGQEVPLPRDLKDDDHTGYREELRQIQDIITGAKYTVPRISLSHRDVPMDEEERAVLDSITVTSKVVDRRWIDGHDSYAIRIRFDIPGDSLTEGLDPTDPEMAMLQGATYFGEFITWVSADLPYPVLFEMRSGLVRSGREQIDSHYAFVLVRHDPGSRPIPWKETPIPAVPSPERSPGSQLVPADGQGSRIPFRLSEAIADTRSVLAPAAFQLWLREHPDALLVAAELRRGQSHTESAPSHLWHLVYATTRGDGFEVMVERAAGVTFPTYRSAAERKVPTFKASDLPPNPIPIAYAEAAWRQTASADYASRAPNFVRWGFDLDFRPSCWGQDYGLGDASPLDFRRLVVGYTEEGACVDPSTTARESAVALDTATGLLIGLYEYRAGFDFHPVLGRSDARNEDYALQALPRKEIYAGVQPPEVGDAVVVSSGTLALFLALYFLPALKFVASKAWIGVAGYAKLRKDELLDNRIRDQILQVVRNDPGINTTDLAKRVDAGWGTVVYHLSVLERHNLVSSLIDGRFHRFFPVGVIDFSTRGQVAVMKNERTKQIFELIDVEPGIVQEALARRVGISAPAAIFHLKRLEEVGMVGRVKKGRKVHYYTNEKMLLPPADAPPLQGMEFQ